MLGFVASASPDTLHLSSLNDRVEITTFAAYSAYSKGENLTTSSYSRSPISRVSHDSVLVSHFWVKNDLARKQRLFLKVPANEFWEMHTRDPIGREEHGYNGYLEDESRLDVPRQKYYFDLLLRPGEVREVTLTSYNISTRSVRATNIYALSELVFYRDRYGDFYEDRWGLGISIFYQGAIALMMLYMFFLYFQNNRDKTYLYYGLYMFCGLYYMLQKIAGDGPFFFLFADNAILRHILNEPMQWLIYIFYNLFVIHFLQLKKHSPRLYRFLSILNIVYGVYMLAQLAFMLITFDKVTDGYLYIISRVLVIAVSLFIIVEIARTVKSPLVLYIVTGSTLFLLFTVTAMLYSLGLGWLPETNLYPINFMQIGIMLEILCFSLGLGRRIRLEAVKKDKLQSAYIDQLVRNEELIQQSYNQLSKEMNARTDEIVFKTRELEREREKKIAAVYEKQLAESEMDALKLQMNPHFIFNSLNSIRYYILKEEPEKASDYITSFSRLLRMILQHSKQKTIKLSEELEALRLYLEFERQRFEDKFEFAITLDEQVNPEEINIQPMIIQPFVENSIWHGLMHKEEKGHLRVEVGLLNYDTLKVIIEDDGIGREESKRLEEPEQRKTYKSMGLQITRDRLRLMEKLQHGDTGYEIQDLVDEEGNSIGTRVTIKIKIK